VEQFRVIKASPQFVHPEKPQLDAVAKAASDQGVEAGGCFATSIGCYAADQNAIFLLKVTQPSNFHGSTIYLSTSRCSTPFSTRLRRVAPSSHLLGASHRSGRAQLGHPDPQDAAGSPLVTAWVAGHNHNMGIYWPRGQSADSTPPRSSGATNGIYIFNNGAGGRGTDSQGLGAQGTMPDYCNNDSEYGFLRIELADAHTATFQNFSTGKLGLDRAWVFGPSVTINV
jgi:hypothetical protein